MPGKADPHRPRAMRAWDEAFGSPPPQYLSVAFMDGGARGPMEPHTCYRGNASHRLPCVCGRVLERFTVCASPQPAQAADNTRLSATHLVRSGFGRVVGCAASPELSSLGLAEISLLSGKFTGKYSVSSDSRPSRARLQSRKSIV